MLAITGDAFLDHHVPCAALVALAGQRSVNADSLVRCGRNHVALPARSVDPMPCFAALLRAHVAPTLALHREEHDGIAMVVYGERFLWRFRHSGGFSLSTVPHSKAPSPPSVVRIFPLGNRA